MCLPLPFFVVLLRRRLRTMRRSRLLLFLATTGCLRGNCKIGGVAFGLTNRRHNRQTPNFRARRKGKKDFYDPSSPGKEKGTRLSLFYFFSRGFRLISSPRLLLQGNSLEDLKMYLLQFLVTFLGRSGIIGVWVFSKKLDCLSNLFFTPII